MANVTVPCPQCGASLQTDEANLGRKGRCKRCGTVFELRRGRGVPQTPEAALAQLAAAGDRGELDGEEGMDRPSLVLLLSGPRKLDEASLRQIAGQALGRHFSTEKDAADFVVGTDEMGQIQAGFFMLKLGGQIYVVHNDPRPYLDDVDELVAEVADPRFARIVGAHKAWLAMDLMIGQDTIERRQAYQTIGKVIAALAGSDTLALLRPETMGVIPYRPDLAEVLRGSDPLSVFQPQAPPEVELILMLAEPIDVDFDMISLAANRAFDVASPSDASAAQCAVEDEDIVLHVAGHELRIGECPKRYVNDPTGLLDARHPAEVREAVGRHQAFLEVCLTRLRPGADLGDLCRRIGSLLIRLAGAKPTALYVPKGDHAHVWDTALKQRITGDQAEEILAGRTPEKMVCIDDDDPAMQAAVAEARRRWPEFVAAFHKRTDRQTFIIKAPFTENDQTEFMWVVVDGIGDQIVSGYLANAPVNLRGYAEGDYVQVRLSDLNDWAYGQDGPEVGGFTMKVLADRQGQA